MARVSVRRRRHDGKELPGRGKVLPGTPPLLEWWHLVGGRLRLLADSISVAMRS